MRNHGLEKMLKALLLTGVILVCVLGSYFLTSSLTESARSSKSKTVEDTSAASVQAGSQGLQSTSGGAADTSSPDAAGASAADLASSPASTDAGGQADPSKYNTSDNWSLILINVDHPYPAGYVPDVTTVDNEQQTDVRCAPKLTQMLQDCRAAGYDPLVISGYRTHSQQIQDFDSMTQMYVNAGYSEEDARAKTAESVAIPGTSEHEAALSVDIGSEHNTAVDNSQDSEAVQEWLHENCWKYGYVLRYPEGKQDITKIIYESWHYRYVGDTAAKVMHDEGICLEEYLEKYVEPFTSLEELDRQAMEVLGLTYTGQTAAEA
ncbi:MAG: M15 family metallopeptidase [Bilifractor sp.]